MLGHCRELSKKILLRLLISEVTKSITLILCDRTDSNEFRVKRSQLFNVVACCDVANSQKLIEK